jgi:TrpR family trp operon transcriptional repressor
MVDFNEVVDLVYSVQDKSLLEDFLLGITTPRERHDLAQRLEIVRRLLAHEPQKKIAQELGVGVATVTRGSKELAAGRFKCLKQGTGLS